MANRVFASKMCVCVCECCRYFAVHFCANGKTNLRAGFVGKPTEKKALI